MVAEKNAESHSDNNIWWKLKEEYEHYIRRKAWGESGGKNAGRIYSSELSKPSEDVERVMRRKKKDYDSNGTVQGDLRTEMIFHNMIGGRAKVDRSSGLKTEDAVETNQQHNVDSLVRAGSFYDIDLHVGKKHGGAFKPHTQNVSEDNGLYNTSNYYANFPLRNMSDDSRHADFPRISSLQDDTEVTSTKPPTLMVTTNKGQDSAVASLRWQQ